MPAKIYDEDFVKSELQGMLQELKNNEQIYLINQLFFDKNYSRSRFHEWRKDFANNEYIRTLLEQIEGILENRIAHGTLLCAKSGLCGSACLYLYVLGYVAQSRG